jgi:hypothetical protein
MASKDPMGLYINGNAVTIKANSFSGELALTPYKSVTVITGATIGSVGSSDMENQGKKKVKFAVPYVYGGFNVAEQLMKMLDDAGGNGVSVIGKSPNGVKLEFKQCTLAEQSEVKDDGERFVEVTLEGVAV